MLEFFIDLLADVSRLC